MDQICYQHDETSKLELRYYTAIVGYFSFQAEPRKAAKEATKKIRKKEATNNDQPATFASEADKMHIPAHLYDLYGKPRTGTLNYEACKKICDDPDEREQYFPVATAVRRFRPLAGSEIPEAVEKRVKSQLPRSCSAKRPFRSTDAPVCLSRKRRYAKV